MIDQTTFNTVMGLIGIPGGFFVGMHVDNGHKALAILAGWVAFIVILNVVLF